MNLADTVLSVNHDLPIRTAQAVHNGKVRSVYWLTAADSRRLIEERGYAVAADAELAVMVISDRISAFECIWRGQGGMAGVPGKGAALNAISNHWFDSFRKAGLNDSHILEVPHPLVWLVQKAQPVMIEAIARQYITGSMWRAYQQGERSICGIELPDNLEKNQKLPELLITPSTKGILRAIPGVPEQDDSNVSRMTIEQNYAAFNFDCAADIDRYENLLRDGFQLISEQLQAIDQIFVDTKFEFGYIHDAHGQRKLIYMDEVGTPDSSRIWDGAQYREGNVVENSKEAFRQALLSHFPDPDILTNKARMAERTALAEGHELPLEIMQQVSDTYVGMAEKIIGAKLPISDNPKAEIIDVLHNTYGIIV